MSQALVLCYHAVSGEWPAALSVRPDALNSQLRLLAQRGYRSCTFTELARGNTGPGKWVAITFDDAYRSVIELAAPIMEQLGFIGTVFAPTDYVGRDVPMSWPGIDHWLDSPHRDDLVPMNWQELRSLSDCGWEIGSHTCSHPRLTGLGSERLRAELETSRRSCEREMGGPCTSLAYPYGDHDDRVVAATAAAGYEAAGTLPFRLSWSSPLRIGRMGIYHGDGRGRFAIKALQPFRRLRNSRLAAEAARIRRG